MALMTLVDKITKYLDDGEYVVGIFLDFSKAFDMVNHIILLKKNCRFMVYVVEVSPGFRVT